MNILIQQISTTEHISVHDTEREHLEEKAKENICSCFFWDLCNSMEDMRKEELQAVISDPYTVHAEDDSYNECPQWRQEKAEIIADAEREQYEL